MLECFVVSGDSPDGLLRTGDYIAVDWSRRPEIGFFYAAREGNGSVRLARFEGEELHGDVGRCVNPSQLLRVQRPRVMGGAMANSAAAAAD